MNKKAKAEAEQLSDCHHAPVTAKPGIPGWIECTLCKQPCGLKDWEGTGQDLTKQT